VSASDPLWDWISNQSLPASDPLANGPNASPPRPSPDSPDDKLTKNLQSLRSYSYNSWLRLAASKRPAPV